MLKTDLPKKVVDKETIHRRYKDLSQVEWAFRTMKTGHLDVRPVFVRKESRTRGHAFVVMLAYMIIRRLTEAWRDLEITVEEGIEVLKTICSVEVKIGLGKTICKVPDPRPLSQKLLEALKARLPVAIPARTFEVVTKKKLVDRRRSQ